MTKKPSTHPRGYRTCTASLAVADVPAALAFYQAAFGAETRATDKEGQPGFAAIKIGTSMMFLTEGWALSGHVPGTGASTATVAHHMYVEDVDTALETACAAGAKLISPAADAYWGERCATLADPFGHLWTLATRLENLNAAEIQDRRNVWMGHPVKDHNCAEHEAA